MSGPNCETKKSWLDSNHVASKVWPLAWAAAARAAVGLGPAGAKPSLEPLWATSHGCGPPLEVVLRPGGLGIASTAIGPSNSVFSDPSTRRFTVIGEAVATAGRMSTSE